MNKGSIWLPKELGFITSLLNKFHTSPIGGHMGVTKTLARIGENFTWSGMKHNVSQFVAACVDCQCTKYVNRKQGGLLCPLPIPSHPWKDISLDQFSKGIHLGILQTHFTAYTVALFFMDIMDKIHGMPYSLISDQYPLFICHLWQELFKLSGTKLRMSSAYHPQTDGQTEVLNRVVEQYLRTFVRHQPASWGKLLM